MTTRKLQGPLGGDYQTDGNGNAVLLNTYPLTEEDDVPLRLADHEARIALTEPQMRASRVLEGLLRPRLPLTYPYPDNVLTTDAPTITDSTSQTITSNYVAINSAEKEIAYEGLAFVEPVWNATYSYWDHRENGITSGGSPVYLFGSIAFTLIGDTVELFVRPGNASIIKFWVWVDGKPVTAEPQSPESGPTSSGAWYVKLVFGTSGVRNIQFLTSPGGFRGARVPNTGTMLAPSGLGPKVYAIGDSLLEGATGFDRWSSWGPIIARSAGWRLYVSGQGGSGYTKDGTSGQKLATLTSRPQNIVTVNPDLALIFIGGNDSDVAYATLRAAVESVYGYLNEHAPNVPCVVVGEFPNAFASIFNGSTRIQSRKAIRDGVMDYPNVIGFIDPIGDADTGTTYSAISSGTSYNVGDRYYYFGALWEVTVAHTASSVPTYQNVKRLTWLYGTGNAGTPAGNGNRDVLLSSDDVHPTQAGQNAYAAWIANGTAKCIQHWLKTGQRLGLS